MSSQFIDYLPGKTIRDFSHPTQFAEQIAFLISQRKFPKIKTSFEIVKYKVLPSKSDGVLICIEYTLNS